MHQRGLAITTYINPMVCTDYQPVFDRAAASGGLIENTLGDPYLFQYSTNTSFQVAEFDFTSPGGRDAFASVIDEAIGDGHDGWMEDFGEYTPLDSQTSGGIPGTVEHNRYATDYHCAASNAAAAAGRPIVRSSAPDIWEPPRARPSSGAATRPRPGTSTAFDPQCARR